MRPKIDPNAQAAAMALASLTTSLALLISIPEKITILRPLKQPLTATLMRSSIVSIANNQGGVYWGSVLPNFRKQGIGTALVEHRMNTAKKLGYTSIVAHNMTPSLGLCKRLGFEQVGGLPLYMWDTEHYNTRC